jgi:SAM-dependent methyltransferase
MLILNLGCGTRTATHPDVLNIDWSLKVRIKKSRLLSLAASALTDVRRRSRLDQMQGRLLAHDLSKGIPFASESVDFVYHSHVLEHLDRPVAREFLAETRRVLKPGGVCRIVVPDFEFLCRAYVEHIDTCRRQPQEVAGHESFVEGVLEQSVRREAAGARGRTGLARLVEQLLLGDARRRGETHQWMYGRISLPHILSTIGYRSVTVETWRSSRIPGWNEIGLDSNGQGGEYTPDSLYVEAQK